MSALRPAGDNTLAAECAAGVAVLESSMRMPDLYVGKIVHYVGVSDHIRSRHLPAIVVRIAVEGLNRIVLTIFTHQVERGAATSTMREPSVDDSAEMTPGSWHYIEDCHRIDGRVGASYIAIAESNSKNDSPPDLPGKTSIFCWRPTGAGRFIRATCSTQCRPSQRRLRFHRFASMIRDIPTRTCSSRPTYTQTLCLNDSDMRRLA